MMAATCQPSSIGNWGSRRSDLRLLIAIAAGFLCFQALSDAGEGQPPRPNDGQAVVELRIPLYQGTHYRPRDLAEQYRDRFGIPLPIDDVSPTPRLLTAGEWAALQVANRTGILSVERHDNELLLRFPTRSDGSERRTISLLERLLGISVPETWDGLGLSPAIDDIAAATRGVLLIHGLASSTKAMVHIRAAFVEAGIQVVEFDYPRDITFAAAGERLRSDLNSLARRHPDMQLAVIAHSMGGLVVRYALEGPAGNPGSVTDVMFLGTPHYGSDLACADLNLDVLLTVLPRLRWRAVEESGLAGAMRDLEPGSDALRALNRHPKPRGVRYHVAAGTRGLWTETQTVELIAEAQRIMNARRDSAERQELVLRVLRSTELCTGQGDGAVSVPSAAHRTADQIRHFDLNHTDLLLRRASADAPTSELRAWMLAIVQGGSER